MKSRNTSHGYAGTKIYRCWRGMIARCYSPNRKNYKYYGGRGIKVCKRWHKFKYFLADMGEVPEGKSIDRYPDNDGDYKLKNCRWATPEQQIHNRRPRSEWA